ncbi:hypothetical protein [Hyphomicrobium sp.]|uniref:hypothetical protein n=1 Tax=Hyphomicrobium sp. TaxID=82 RepID=UPI000F93C092|nr:hypothetical protein [Hyphomicrobium sp.]RUP10246.1 MAG: hypothetical protein EKK38_07410 [Hyphomicrobium sp.]
MKAMREILFSLIGLFLDDEFMAVAILAVVGATAFLTVGLGVPAWWAGAFLLLSMVLVLAGSVLRTARRTVRRD